MRGSFLVASVVLAIASAGAHIHASDVAPHAEREFRLLELGGRKARWAIPDTGLPPTIRYAFLTERVQFPGARNCDAMLPADAVLTHSRIGMADFRREVRAAFSMWESAANIRFVETSSVAEAGILIGADGKSRGRAFTNVALQDAMPVPEAGVAAIRQSLICLNPQRAWKVGFDGNLDVYDVRFTVAHEIGHAIGLDHPSPEGQLMSFRYVEHARGLQPGDIAGATALYGNPGAAPAMDGAGGAAASTGAGAGNSGDRTFGLGEPTHPERGR